MAGYLKEVSRAMTSSYVNKGVRLLPQTMRLREIDGFFSPDCATIRVQVFLILPSIVALSLFEGRLWHV
jgi:hypothetical protein